MNFNKRDLFLTILLPIQILVITFLKHQPDFIESYYSQGMYPHISKLLRILFGWIPFSVGDLLIIFLLIQFIYEVYQLIRTKFYGFKIKLVNFLGYISLLYFCFYVFWGLNYFRRPLADNLGLQHSKYTTQQLVKTTEKIILKLNDYHFKITQHDTVDVNLPYTTAEIYNEVYNAYYNLSVRYPQLEYSNHSIKNSAVSLLQSYNHTAGYLNPITGEAQVNKMLPKTGFPATACHEVAHQIGWSAENDANFVGFLATTASHDVYFNYSGYRMAYNYCMRELKKRDEGLAKQLQQTVNKGIIKDFKNAYRFWRQYDNPIEPLFKKGYNSYLKANNQEKGIKSYSYVVDLLIAYFEQKHNSFISIKND